MNRKLHAALSLALLAGACMSTAANAMSIRELRGLDAVEKTGPLYVQYYLIGVMEGLREASDEAAREGKPPIFCVNGRKLEPRMARSIFDAEIQRNPGIYEADMPVELVLSNGLKNSYRCS